MEIDGKTEFEVLPGRYSTFNLMDAKTGDVVHVTVQHEPSLPTVLFFNTTPES
jgi:hypothetical protein